MHEKPLMEKDATAYDLGEAVGLFSLLFSTITIKSDDTMQHLSNR